MLLMIIGLILSVCLLMAIYLLPKQEAPEMSLLVNAISREKNSFLSDHFHFT